MLIQEKYHKKLLVEGNDDQHVIRTLCGMRNISENFDVIDCGGYTGILEQIPDRIKESGVLAIGVILDADQDVNTRWSELSTKFNKSGYTMPENLPQNGLILHNQGQIKIGVWVMPDNNTNGMLEDFVRFLIPSNDQLMPEVNVSLDSIEGKALNIYNKVLHRAKAQIHTWLAWQEDPGTPMGLAITKKYLTADHPSCVVFTDWLKNTFS